MAKTIAVAFETFHTRLTPNITETEALKRHRESLSQCLKNNFNMIRFFRTGSIGNGTSINGYSDTDYFAVLPRENLNSNSITTLRKVKGALDVRFPNSGVRIDSPAVVCPFGTKASETTEIVPADYMKQSNGYNVYDIPDTLGGWMKSSPGAHNNYVTKANSKAGIARKVKPLIRFIKAWNFYRDARINSFYLELRVTKYALGEKSIMYPIDIIRIFKQLIDIKLASMQDPVGVSGYVSACSSDSIRESALSKLKTALTRVQNAYDCEKDNKIKDAFMWWNKVYNDNFPSYY